MGLDRESRDKDVVTSVAKGILHYPRQHTDVHCSLQLTNDYKLTRIPAPPSPNLLYVQNYNSGGH